MRQPSIHPDVAKGLEIAKKGAEIALGGALIVGFLAYCAVANFAEKNLATQKPDRRSRQT